MEVTWPKIILIIVACAFAIWIPQYSALNSSINRSREGCERLNTTREQLYQTIDIASNLVQNKELVAAFEKEKEDLVNSVARYADETTPEDVVDIDCSEAYAKPFPLSIFDN